MSRPKGGKERPTSHYSVQRHLTFNNYHNFLLMNYSQVGSFPLWSLLVGVRRARFRLMSDVEAGIDDSQPRVKLRRWLPTESISSYYQE